MILITGGATGIGLATAHNLITHYDKEVIICGRSSFAQLENKDKIQQYQKSFGLHRLQYAKVDISKINNLRRLFLRIGDIECLINNAVVCMKRPEFGHTTVHNSINKKMIETNCIGTALICDLMFNQSRPGTQRIINVSSFGALDPYQKLSHYGATKAYVETLTKGLMRDVHQYLLDVFKVMIIRFGAVDTEAFWKLFPHHEPRDVLPVEFAAASLAHMATSSTVENGLVRSVYQKDGRYYKTEENWIRKD